jgi:hypothetical protein
MELLCSDAMTSNKGGQAESLSLQKRNNLFRNLGNNNNFIVGTGL